MAFTPVAKQLQQRLEDRRAQFRSWLFKWHQLNEPGGRVEVDLFDGRTSHMGGLAFDGSARLVFWDAITRGVRKEVMAELAWVDEQIRRYNRSTALESIDQAAGLLISFVRAVRRDAIEKDRILRGDGIHFPPENDAGHWRGTSEEEIRAYGESLKQALPADISVSVKEPGGIINRLNVLTDKNRWWIALVGVVAAVVSLGLILG